jgi:hypothetical protein
LFALLSYVSIDHHEMKPMAKTKNCELCDSAFECKGLLGCWCRSIDISREQLGKLSKRTSDCICPNCLAEYKDRDLNLICQAVLLGSAEPVESQFCDEEEQTVVAMEPDRL